MNDILVVPAERDMPADRSARMRAHLLATVRRPSGRGSAGRRRLVIVVAAVAAAAGLTLPTLVRQTGGDAEVLAMSAAELPPPLRDAVRQCLRWNAQQVEDGRSAVSVQMADLAVAAQRQRRAVALFLTPTGYFSCEMSMPARGEMSGGTSGEQWRSRDWMPGPVQRVGLSSTDVDGGHVMVTGRVSDRVHRLVLDHGDGQTTGARVERGVFGLVSDGVVAQDAELVSYDRLGQETGRRPLFQPSDHHNHCYVDPSGEVVYGDPGPACRPAEPWTR